MRTPLTERITLRLEPELRQMVEAASVYEDRKASDFVRVALKAYMASQGYFDPEFITRIATKERHTP